MGSGASWPREPLAKKRFIIECLGELVDREEAKDRFAKARDGYFMAVSSLGLVVDATKTGCAARFAKHSEEPNCVIETWKCGIDERYGLFALREIGENEELTYDHGWIRELRQPIKGGRAGPGAAARRASGALGGEDTDDDVEKGLAAPRPFAEEEDEQYCDGCHAPVSGPGGLQGVQEEALLRLREDDGRGVRGGVALVLPGVQPLTGDPPSLFPARRRFRT